MYCYVYDYYDVCTLSRMYVLRCMYVTYYPVREKRKKTSGEEANSDCLADVARGDTLPPPLGTIECTIMDTHIHV